MVNYKATIRKIYLNKLNQKVKSIRDVSRGFENKVFVVKTNKDISVIRIPKAGKPPFAGKHQALREYWASKAWGKLGIPVPKVMIFDESRKLANFDYVIETYIPGKNLNQVKLTKKQTKAIMRKLGKLLKKMHKVKTKKYGLLVSKRTGEHDTCADLMKSWIKGALKNLRKNKLLPNKTLQQTKKYFKDRADILDFHSPKLLHNDLGRSNIRIKTGKISGIIDFGDAFSGDPIYDVARTYQRLYRLSYLDEFLKSYGKINKRKFNYYLLYHACWELNWAYEHKNKEVCKKNIIIINSIVKSST